MTEISNNDKIISVSDITARVDELQAERAEHDKANHISRDASGDLETLTEDGEPVEWSWESENADEAIELALLEKLLNDLRGRGTSHEWGGDMFPDSLIADSHFPEYAQEFAEECGEVSRDASWIVIDWEATANGMKNDYRSVYFDCVEYWHRA